MQTGRRAERVAVEIVGQAAAPRFVQARAGERVQVLDVGAAAEAQVRGPAGLAEGRLDRGRERADERWVERRAPDQVAQVLERLRA